MINREQIFPTVLIGLNLLAAVIYAHGGNVRKAVYWFASAVIIASVTY